MARKRTLGGKSPQSGHRVAHCNIKTNHKWMPNIQTKALFSETLGQSIRLTITTQALRSVDKAGGLDLYLLKQAPEDLSGTMRKLQARIRRSQETAA